MVSERTAKRLDALAKEKGIAVIVATSDSPKKRWYSVGNSHSGQWHQIAGFSDAAAVEVFIEGFGHAQ